MVFLRHSALAFGLFLHGPITAESGIALLLASVICAVHVFCWFIGMSLAALNSITVVHCFCFCCSWTNIAFIQGMTLCNSILVLLFPPMEIMEFVHVFCTFSRSYMPHYLTMLSSCFCQRLSLDDLFCLFVIFLEHTS